ncbi:MAG: prolyl oligopeptidase family serine peptidase [Candidatus Aminicenantes bacterium]|nr:prolyl oligopeptidase family serine peptidase [Candidatus Aminicenantes bacterium]
MKIFLKIIPYILILTVLTGSYLCCNKKENGALSNPIEVIDKNGVERNYNLHLPDKSNSDFPLLIYFHGVRSDEFKNKPVLRGYTGSPLEETGLIPFCRINGIALLEILPSYSYKFLDVNAHGWSPFEKEIDGIEKCIDVVIENFSIDSGNIFLAGISAGAVLSHHLANRRPEKYKAILSHSQAYISENNEILSPVISGEKFGVVFCYTKGDYDDLKEFCEESYNVYKKNGYNSIILRDLPPISHKWSNSTNGRFWRSLLRTGGNSD